MSDTIVIMRFRLQPGRSEADWLDANQQVNSWIRQQPGFQFRSLSQTGDGEWIIIGYWASAEAADAAEKKFARDMEDMILTFVDRDSFKLTRSTARQMLQSEVQGQQA